MSSHRGGICSNNASLTINLCPISTDDASDDYIVFQSFHAFVLNMILEKTYFEMRFAYFSSLNYEIS